MHSQYGGSPLYQACALDLPHTTKALLEHGASVVQMYKGQTPLQAALGQKDSRCVKVRRRRLSLLSLSLLWLLSPLPLLLLLLLLVPKHLPSAEDCEATLRVGSLDISNFVWASAVLCGL